MTDREPKYHQVTKHDMTYDIAEGHDYELKSFASGAFSARCPECGKRHRGARDYGIFRDWTVYVLRCGDYDFGIPLKQIRDYNARNKAD